MAATGKSIPAEKATKLLRLLPDSFVHSGELTKIYLLQALEASVLHQQITPPTKGKKKISQLIADPSLILFHDELAAGVGSGDLAMDLLKHLVQLYAVPDNYDYGTKEHGLIAIERPIISWIACTTIPWLARAIPKDLIDSGLIARVNAITAPFPKTEDMDVVLDEQMWLDLVHDLILISQIEGEFTLDQPAADSRREQNRKSHQVRLAMTDEITQAMYGREPDHTLKVAMAISAATRDDRIITEPILDAAYRMVNDARNNSVDLFVAGATTGSVQFKIRVANQIKRAPLGTIGRTKLTSALSRYGSATEVDMAIHSLQQEGAIVIYQDRVNHGQTYVWKMKEGDQNGSGGEDRGTEAEGFGEAV